MIAVALLLGLAFVLVILAVAVVVALCCLLGARPASRSAPRVHPGWAAGRYAQTANSLLPGQARYGVPAVSAVWPGVWVGPAIPADDAAVMQRVESQHEGVLRQRRQLSGPARRVIVHEGTR